ncbi:MFS transporter [Actinomadura sp. 9N215]|uniref:MFS transporter n=1 Tax=Actinomadura sp. 9N215 TaxID=3375150 RepID=UPI0037A0CB1E
MITTLDATLVNVALPVIGSMPGADTAALSWVVNAYTLALAGLLALGGATADRIGRKTSLYIGLALLIAGSACAALAGSVLTLIVGRWVMGAGAAFVIPTGLSTISAVFDVSSRALASGVLGAAGLLGAPLGPLLGGVLLDLFSWPSVFLLNVALLIPPTLLAWKLVPETRAREEDTRPFDWRGATLATVGTSALVWAIVGLPGNDWLSLRVLGLAATGTTILVAFVAWQRRAREPMLDLQGLNRVLAAGVTVLFWCYFALLGSLFVLTQYLQLVLDYRPLEAGVGVLPVVATTVVAFLAAGKLADHWGLRAVVVSGLVLVAAGLVVMSAATPDSGFGIVLAALLLVGLGMGTILPLVPVAMINTQPQEKAGAVSAIADTGRYLGGAFGTAVLGSMTALHFRADMTGATSGPAANDLTAAIRASAETGGDSGHALQETASTAYTAGMATAHLVAAALIVVAILAALVLPASKRTDP